MTVQITSIISYYEVLNKLSKKQKEVLLAVKQMNRPVNNLMVSKFMFKPINTITPRMNELRHKSILIYHHTEACPFTGRSSNFYCIKSYINDCMS